jgi:hypothetical protein
MKLGEGKHLLIKDYITRNIDTASRHVETLVALMLRDVSKKHTLLGSKGKFVRSIWTKVRPTSTTKSPNERIGCLGVKELFNGRIMIKNRSRKSVD